MESGNSMKLSTIPITLRNGRVRPVAREYWRLVLTGRMIHQNDEYLSFSTGEWMKTVRAGEKVNRVNESHYRRRVKGNKS